MGGAGQQQQQRWELNCICNTITAHLACTEPGLRHAAAQLAATAGRMGLTVTPLASPAWTSPASPHGWRGCAQCRTGCAPSALSCRCQCVQRCPGCAPANMCREGRRNGGGWAGAATQPSNPAALATASGVPRQGSVRTAATCLFRAGNTAALCSTAGWRQAASSGGRRRLAAAAHVGQGLLVLLGHSRRQSRIHASPQALGPAPERAAAHQSRRPSGRSRREAQGRRLGMESVGEQSQGRKALSIPQQRRHERELFGLALSNRDAGDVRVPPAAAAGLLQQSTGSQASHQQFITGGPPRHAGGAAWRGSTARASAPAAAGKFSGDSSLAVMQVYGSLFIPPPPPN